MHLLNTVRKQDVQNIQQNLGRLFYYVTLPLEVSI